MSKMQKENQKLATLRQIMRDTLPSSFEYQNAKREMFDLLSTMPSTPLAKMVGK